MNCSISTILVLLVVLIFFQYSILQSLQYRVYIVSMTKISLFYYIQQAYNLQVACLGKFEILFKWHFKYQLPAIKIAYMLWTPVRLSLIYLLYIYEPACRWPYMRFIFKKKNIKKRFNLPFQMLHFNFTFLTTFQFVQCSK